MTSTPIPDATHLLPRLYSAGPLALGDTIPLTDEQAHYLRHVLRREDGSMLRIFHAANGEFLAVLGYSGKKGAVATPQTILRSPDANATRRHLVFSPLKKDKMDFLVEKAVELGVTDLHPVIFQRSIVRDIRPDRLTAQIIESAEQCERLDIPVLHPLLTLPKLLQQWPAQIPLFAALERQDHPSLKNTTRPTDCGFLVGPEGGVTADESEMILGCASARPVHLGPRILRAETAALYGLSLLSYS